MTRRCSILPSAMRDGLRAEWNKRPKASTGLSTCACITSKPARSAHTISVSRYLVDQYIIEAPQCTAAFVSCRQAFLRQAFNWQSLPCCLQRISLHALVF